MSKKMSVVLLICCFLLSGCQKETIIEAPIPIAPIEEVSEQNDVVILSDKQPISQGKEKLLQQNASQTHQLERIIDFIISNTKEN